MGIQRRIWRVAMGMALALLVMGAFDLSPGPSPKRRGENGGGELAGPDALLAKYYPAPKSSDGCSRYVGIAPVADGFAPPDMQPGLNTPGSRWKNPAKTVQSVFPKTFSNPVRVCSGVADVSAVPLNANAASSAEIAADGSLVYRDAFGAGIDVMYRCEALKTEEYIVIRQPLFPLPLREGVGGGVSSPRNSKKSPGTPVSNLSPQNSAPSTFSWDLHPGALKPRLTPAHTIELCDEKGVPRLRINAPEGKDAGGKVLRAGKELRITLEGNRVTLAADVKGLEFPVVIDPTWSSTGAFAVNRENHINVRLNDGTVLATGGNATGVGSSLIAQAERFDPVTEVWSSAGTMAVARTLHTATLLGNGNVLVAAGNSGTVEASCEVYDPANDSWTTMTPLNTARLYASATLLADGTLLIVGGNTGSSFIATSEIYDVGLNTWTYTNSALNNARSGHRATRLGDNTVLIAGGDPTYTQCELYDPSSKTFSATGSLTNSISRITTLNDGTVLSITGGQGPQFATELYDPVAHTWSTPASRHSKGTSAGLVTLSNGRALVIGGYESNEVATCEIFDPIQKSWSLTSQLPQAQWNSTATLLQDDRVLVTGGQPAYTNLIYDPKPTANSFSVAGHWGTQIDTTLSSDSIAQSVSYTITSQPQHGTLSGIAPNFIYTAAGPFITDSFTFTSTDSFGTGPQGTVTIDVTNTAPKLQSVSSSVTPAYADNHLPGNQSAVPNQIVSFFVTASDPDGDPLTYTWDFGDGSPKSNEQNPTHSYPEVGTYLAKIIVTDPAGAVAGDLFPGFAGNFVQVLVSQAPVVRLQTSDVVAFGGLPFTFDASTSTDPENAIASYDWDFGDGTPHGAGQVISKVYDNPGTYTVTLTIMDSAGVSSSLVRVIEVLAASEAGLFNGFMNYKVSWNRHTENKDTLSFEARVNVGDVVIGNGTPVALEIAGQRFEGTLDTKLRDFTNANEKWTIKANVRHQPSGSVSVKLALKKASLGLAFNLAGVTVGGDPHDTVSKDISVHLEVGTHGFELQVPSDFKFGGDGTRCKGEGVSE